MKSLYENSYVTQVIDPVAITADTDGDTIDTLHYDGSMAVVAVGEQGETLGESTYILLEVEESDDDSTFSDCDDADIYPYVDGTNDGTFAKIDAAAEDDTCYTVEYRGSKRYWRVVVNMVGTHETGTPIGAVAIRYNKDVQPASS